MTHCLIFKFMSARLISGLVYTVPKSVGLQKDACEHSTTFMACQPPASHNLTSEPLLSDNAVSVRQLWLWERWSRYPQNATTASEPPSPRSDSTIRHSWIPHLRSQLSDVNGATARHYVMWYATVEITPHSCTSVLLWRMAHRNVWLDSDGSTFVVGSFWISKMWISFPVSNSFLIQRERWLDLNWCGDDTDIIYQSSWESLTLNTDVHSSILSNSHPDPLVWSAAPWKTSDKQREQSSVYEEEWRRGQQSSLKPRCHLTPGMPCDGFPNYLTFCMSSNT